MKNAEFAYWLQGFFEIQEASGNKVSVVSKEQLNIIRNHLNLTKEADQEYADFILWADGFLTGHEHSDETDLKGKKLVAFREELNKNFKHVLDNRFGDKETLQKLHDGLKKTVDNSKKWPNTLGGGGSSLKDLRLMC